MSTLEGPESVDTVPAPNVLVVDDDSSMAEMLAEGLTERGYRSRALASSREAARLIAEERFDALVTDLRMPRVDGLGLLAVFRKVAPGRPVIVMTAYSAVDTAIESIRQGAYHYLTKPFKLDELVLFLRRALAESEMRRETVALRRALQQGYAARNIIGSSGAMRETCDLLSRMADATAPVLILGETGTGKGLVAKAIHAESARANAAFVAINCAALPEHLLESELFGHVRGAFTGATSNRTGLFEEANGGTVFLDEIGEMPVPLQAKLLTVIDGSTVRALGSNRERPIDARILAATHRNLREREKEGLFREDLRYRLEVLTLEVPPLRRRREDLPLLIEHFLTQSKRRHPKSPVERIVPEAMSRMLDYRWPGNVRELEHVIERLIVLGRNADITVGDLPAHMESSSDAPMKFDGEIIPMRELQRRYAQWAYERLGGRKVLTAERLGVDFKTFSKWLDPLPERDSIRPDAGTQTCASAASAVAREPPETTGRRV